MSTSIMPATMAAGGQSEADAKAALEAEIRKLEEELERQRLEAQIRQLEKQLAESKGEAVPSEEDEDCIIIEEIVDDTENGEEYEEEEYEEEELGDETEVEEEIVEEEVVEAPSAAAATTSPNPKDASWIKPASDANVVAPQAATVPAGSASAEAVKSQARPKWVPFSQRNPEAFKKGMAPPPGMENRTNKPTPHPPIKFTQRTIPTGVPSSPDGQETPMEKMLGKQLIKNVKFAKVSTNGGLQGQQITLLYFAAAWRSECKRFAPLLSDFYKLSSKESNMECIYVSVDRTLFEFKDCYNKMPYLALPTGTTQLKNELAKQLKINDLPALVVLDTASGQVITTKGVDEVTALENRDKFQALELVEKWKAAAPVPVSSVKIDNRLKNGNQKKGIVYWQDP